MKDYIVLPDSFSQENWTRYFYQASDYFSEERTDYPLLCDEDFSSIQSLGIMDFSDLNHAKIYLVRVEKALSERSFRKKQFTKAIEILKSDETRTGIFIIHDADKNFRLSLVYPIFKGSKRNFSNYKRHSFYVSREQANKTYLLQLEKSKLNSMKELKECFSVEQVSDAFYKEFSTEYKKLIEGIRHSFKKDIPDQVKADFALLFVMRIIFLGFVQKKGWLGNNPDFIRQMIAIFHPEKHPNGIYHDMLRELFFNALNTPPSKKAGYSFHLFDEPFQSQLRKAPYLNGGLYRQDERFDKDPYFVEDSAIQNFISFLFSFNFTLEENTLYDEELELNPEFLGIIFEKLINKDFGAVYTPRLEVDFMCRISLLKYLQTACEIEKADELYKLFFREYGRENESTDHGKFSIDEAQLLLEKLESITVCDPAVGSGAFAVGMLNVLDEIECVLYREYLGKEPIQSAYERKKRIVFKSLYGVEVQEWAVWITQLRLWITLLIEAGDELQRSEDPLLPSFDFKIRQGDSLVQLLGNELFPIEGSRLGRSAMEKQINDLISLKEEYFDNKSKLSLKEIIDKQKKLYIDLLKQDKRVLERKIKAIESAANPEGQSDLFADSYQSEIELISKKQLKEKSDYEYQIAQINLEIDKIQNEKLPFFWRLDFPEIFIQKGGFDVVIGNPPYIAQEQIGDPKGRLSNEAYKQKLKEMVNQDFPNDIYIDAISGKSDLYAYFYIRGIKLLNPKGIHTFICSNSWLDVGFGVWMQKFLLERCNIHQIIDNLSSRVFQRADINTIISVIGAAQKQVRDSDKTRFVAFKLPFEESLFVENFLAIEATKDRTEYDDLRVNALSRTELMRQGMDATEQNKYTGCKWGGIYIKAPKIYFEIMEKAKDKLVRLGDIAEVKRGVTTGADEFFYVPKSNPFGIEKEFLKPVIKSPRESRSITIDPNKLAFWLFMCPYEKSELKGTKALEYIEKGEKQEKYIKQGKDKGKTIVGIQNVSSVQGRKNWYDLGNRSIPNLITPSGFGDTFKVYLNSEVYANKRLYEIYYSGNHSKLALVLNSSLYFFFVELYTSGSLGDGLLDTTVEEIQNIYVLTPDLLKDDARVVSAIERIKSREISSIFNELQSSIEFDSYYNAIPLADRKALDDLVFQTLGLNQKEIKALYTGLLELTAYRLKKANTFSKKGKEKSDYDILFQKR